MPVTVRPNPYHPTRDDAVLEEPWTSEEVVRAAQRARRPLTAKAVPGTSEHRRLLEAGATVYQRCPPLQLDAASPDVAHWCRTHAVLPVHTLEGVDLLHLWLRWYEVVHRGWSPTAPREELLDLFADLATEIDPARSTGCTVEGDLVAVAFCFPGDDPPEILTEALLPDHPRAREAVASCMSIALGSVDQVVRFDGHVGDPHFGPLWASVPGVYPGPGDPLDLLEIDGLHAAVAE